MSDAPHDPVHAILVTLPGQPPARFLARWSLAARLLRNAASEDQGGEVTDLGPVPGADPADFEPDRIYRHRKDTP